MVAADGPFVPNDKLCPRVCAPELVPVMISGVDDEDDVVADDDNDDDDAADERANEGEKEDGFPVESRGVDSTGDVCSRSLRGGICMRRTRPGKKAQHDSDRSDENDNG
jgi:hypothetical protein